MADYYVSRDGSITKSSDSKKKKRSKYYVDASGNITVTEEEETKESKNKLDFFQKGAFDDGYQFGDVTKSTLGTVADAGIGVIKGAVGLGEGLKDLGQYGVAGVADLFGADNYADKVRLKAQKNSVQDFFKPADDYLNNYSVLGRTSDAITQGVGQVGTIILTGGLGASAGLGAAGTTALTTGTMGLSSMGSGMGEAYRKGATDAEATTYGLIAGTSDALSELMFGGLGKTVKAAGLSYGLSSADDMLAKKISSMFSNQITKNFAEFGIKAGAEGVEEVVAGLSQAVGKKITYMDEEELSKIIEDENLLEQFVVGSVASGIMQAGYIPATQSGSLREANATGRDFITGYSQNEQSVIDKEVENRVAEMEADGKKLDKKAKSKIEEEVKTDLAKGYISIDTIESVLGGETYKGYNSVVEQENTLKKEIEALESMPDNQITVKQKERLIEAREQLKSLDEKGYKSRIKNRLSSEVDALTENDTYLRESYNEKARRSQAYEADLSKYDEKQQQVIQKAVESGILNNTNRTHEFVDMIAKISADKGVLFDFTNNEKLKESGFAVEGKTVNGYVKDGNITLNIHSPKALNAVVGHEITHVLEGTEFYTELQQAVKAYATTKGEYDTRIQELTKLYEGVENVNIENELTADLVGEYLFTDSDFINNLSTQKPNVFKKIYEEIKYLVKTVTGTKEAKELAKVKRAFDKAYKETVNVNTESSYKLSVPEGHTTLSEYEGILGNYYVPKEFKSAIIRDTDIVAEEEFAVARQEIFKKATKARMEGASLSYKDSVLSANHIFYYDNYSETGFNVTKVVNIETDYSSIIDEVLNESINRPDGNIISNRNEEIGNVKRNNNDSSSHDGYRETGAGNAGISANGTTNRQTSAVSENGRNTRVNEVAPIRENAKASSQDGVFSNAQKEYFKDSVVRDENGNLKVMYHGTSKGGHTVFDPYGASKYGLFGVGTYFTDNKSVAESYTEKGKGNNKQVYETYLNITNPIDMDAQANPEAWKKAMPEVDFPESGTNEQYYRAMEEYYTDNEYSKWEASEAALDVLESMGYDGITHIGGGRFNKADDTRHQVYIAFHPEQIKNIDNSNPTTDADIRYSLSEDAAAHINELTDEGLTMTYVRVPNQNTQNYGSTYGQNIEPAGEYMQMDTMQGKYKIDGYEYGIIQFKKPLVLEHINTSDTGWKKTVSDMYNGLTGKKLTKALIKDGYDAIVTYDEFGYSEIVNLNGTKLDDSKYSLSEDSNTEIEDLIDDLDIFLLANGYEIFEETPTNTEIEVAKESKPRYNGDTTTKGKVARLTDERIERLFREYGASNPKYAQAYVASIHPRDFLSLTLKDSSLEKWDNASKAGSDPELYPLNVDELKNQTQTPFLIVDTETGRVEGHEGRHRMRAMLESGITEVPIAVIDYKTKYSKQKESSLSISSQEFNEGFVNDNFTTEINNLIPINSVYREDIMSAYGGKGDINFSLSDKRVIAPTGNYNVYGKDIALEAPVQETVEPAAQETEQVAPVKEAEETALTEEQASERDAQQQPIDESYMPEETQTFDDFDELFSSNTETIPDPFEERDIKEVGKRDVNAYMYDNPEVKPFFQEEAQIMLGELQNSIKGEKTFNDQLYYDTNGEQGWFGTKRETSEEIAYLLDNFKYKYADIEKGLKAIIEDHGAENNAISKRIEFALNDRLKDGYTDFVSGVEIPANQDYINLLKEKQIESYSDDAYNQWAESVVNSEVPAEVAPVETTAESTEDIAPTKEFEAIEPRPARNKEPKMARASYEEMARMIAEEQAQIEGKHPLEALQRREEYKVGETQEEIAEVLELEPTTENNRNKRKWAIFRANVFDKGTPFEDLSLKTKNRELMGKWNYTLYSESRAQRLMGEGDADAGVKSLNEIMEEVNNTGLTKEFYEYMYHKHNVDRMKLEERFGTENKPVFGYSVTAEMSQEIVDQYELMIHPEFVDYAQDVYNYNNYLRQQLVDNGVISQETADLWADMYPHYVPTRRVNDKGLSINVPLDTGRTGVNAPIKKATGGNANILPLFDTMAMRTMQTYRATAKNSFGVELKNTLGTTVENVETNIDEVIDSIDTQESLLQEGKNGRHPTFTVFENGEKVTFEITEDMYDALKPLSDSSFMSKTIRLLNFASNFHRGVLTEYNPVFILTNGIKDIQDILINSQHPARTYTKIPEAFAQLLSKGYWYNEYMNNGGDQNSYFDSETNTFKTENKGLAKLLDMPPLSTISRLNNYVERIPRLAEYIASREAGNSVEVSMLDAARVTTNFRAGGNLTKWANRNGATFLNASVQGALQQVRNVREANMNGLKGWANLAIKFALAGAPVFILNALLWDDDEEYEELSDYVKQNYYIVGKYDDGKFIRIPKGRTVAVIQDAIKQVSNLATGNDEADLKSFLELVVTNIAPANPIESNILAPIIQVKNNETWYGEDLVPTRLQDLPAAEQFDESTDLFSKWLGEKMNISPVKINYLLDQYSGGVGDVLLPMLTPEAESGDDSLSGNILAPLKKKFTVDSVMNNQNVSDLYETSDELTTNAKKSTATDEDVLQNKYINSVKAEMSDLYKQKREIQNSDMSDAEKYKQVREIQSQIVELSKEGLKAYKGVNIDGDYATVGDRHYKRNEEGEWAKLTDKQLEKQEEVTSGLGISAAEYWSNKTEYDYAYEQPEKYAMSKAIGGYETYKGYTSELYDIKADKDENGKSISGSRKEKVLSYIDGLEADYGAKIILFKSEYPSDDTYNEDIIEYLNDREDISYSEMEIILKELGFTVGADGTISW